MANKEVISNWQQTLLVIGFLFGNHLVYNHGIKYAERDTFIAEILAGLIGGLVLLIIAFIINRFPGQDIYQILQDFLGNIGAKAFFIPIFFYALYNAILVLDNMQDFMITMVMQNTPPWVFIGSLSLAAGWVLRHGIEVLARCSELTVPLVIVLLSLLLVLILPEVELKSQLPIFTTSLVDIMKATIVIGSYPYLEAIILVFLATKVKEPQNLYKSHLIAIFVVALFFLSRPILSIAAFGVSEASQYTFVMFKVVRIVSFGDFFERVDLIFLIIIFFTAFIKLGICLYVAAISLEKLLSLKDYKPVVLPISVLAASLALNNYDNYQERLLFQVFSWPLVNLVILIPFGLLFSRAIYKLIKS